MLKKWVSIILAVTFCFAMAVGVSAKTPQEIGLRSVNQTRITNSVDFSGRNAIISSEVWASPDTTKMVITHVLQKKSGSSYKNVSGTSVTHTFYESLADMEDSFPAENGATYRVKTTCRVTSPKGTDTQTKISKAVKN